MKNTASSVKNILVFLWLFIPFIGYGQDDYGCDKCSMLREEYELAEDSEKAEIYEYFRQECLETDTLFFAQHGAPSTPEKAEEIQVIATSKCIDFKEVKQIEKATGKELMSYTVAKKDTVYQFGTKSPSFKGGDEALISYFKENIIYPEESKYSNISGTVYLRLVISSKGKIDQVKVKRSPDDRLSKEAIRCVKAMPDWEPGEFDDKAVSMVYVLPVRFALK